MLKKATFKRGGVHPDDMKRLAKDKAVEILPIPGELYVSMSQHLGAPATPLKAKGDRVEKGEVVGKASSFISADVHSPVSGTVVDVRKVRLATGANADTLVIKPDEEQPNPFTTPYDWKSQSKEEILALVKEMGIVGMGGATFPTSVKFAVPAGKKVEYLVINGVECEPYITCDYRLMLENTDDLLEGAMIAAKAVEPEKIVIGVEMNKMDAVEKLDKRAKELGYPIEIQPLCMKYPQGDEKQLLKAVTGREIPSGKLPLDIGCIVCNTATTYAIFEAVKFHKPLFERRITVSGECINEPKNILAPIGTPFSALIEYCGGMKEGVYELVSGGPMMGFDVPDEAVPMVKGSGGLLALPDKKPGKTFPCVSCGKCVQHCPMGLMPNRMFRNIKNGNYAEAMALGLMDCKECGCCSFSCPSHIDLVQGFKLGKKMGRKK
ncbi:MAG: electron transport complex subunit RsxC [Spirochaetales bacterium]|nr:electron transport complex subunit RsxC [Spirochaetales bacterium]